MCGAPVLPEVILYAHRCQQFTRIFPLGSRTKETAHRCAKWRGQDRWYLTALKSRAPCWVYKVKVWSLERKWNLELKLEVRPNAKYLTLEWKTLLSMYVCLCILVVSYRKQSFNSLLLQKCIFFKNFWIHSPIIVKFDREWNNEDTDLLHTLGRQEHGWKSDSQLSAFSLMKRLHKTPPKSAHGTEMWLACPQERSSQSHTSLTRNTHSLLYLLVSSKQWVDKIALI